MEKHSSFQICRVSYQSPSCLCLPWWMPLSSSLGLRLFSRRSHPLSSSQACDSFAPFVVPSSQRDGSRINLFPATRSTFKVTLTESGTVSCRFPPAYAWWSRQCSQSSQAPAPVACFNLLAASDDLRVSSCPGQVSCSHLLFGSCSSGSHSSQCCTWRSHFQSQQPFSSHQILQSEGDE